MDAAKLNPLTGPGSAPLPAGKADAVTALSVRNIAKTFGGARALKGISFDVAPGEVHALLGQNGSGKSTFVKILAGYHAPDPGGSLSLRGRAVTLPLRPGSSRDLGLAFVHQQLGLIPSLTVLENLRVSSITARRKAFIDWTAERHAAEDALNRLGIQINLTSRIADLPQVDRALVAIVRAFEDLRARNADPGLLLLDEPTPFLPREGVAKLFALMRQVAASGASVLFISHDIDEVMEITDRATILRDGELAGSLVTADACKQDFVTRIVGRHVKVFDAKRSAAAALPLRARVQGVGRAPDLATTSLTLHAGEIVGLTGLIGSGFDVLPYVIFGATPAEAGTLLLDGETLNLVGMTPRRALRAGVALLPADRQGASGIGGLSVAENVMVLALSRFFGRLGLNRRGLARRARELCGAFEVRPSDPHLPLRALSGGNAQKVLLAKWLSQHPKLLLLDEPTQGVDVGSRQQLLRAIKMAAQGGAAVLCASTDFEQLAAICDRVVIFNRGRVTVELAGGDLTKSCIAESCYVSLEPAVA